MFKEYLNRLCANEALGLSLDSIDSYYVGDMLRAKDSTQNPDLLPYGYLVGNHDGIMIMLKNSTHACLDSLCFETLVPKTILQRYISLLNDYKHLLFCGQNGTGKSLLAKKIAEYLVKM